MESMIGTVIERVARALDLVSESYTVDFRIPYSGTKKTNKDKLLVPISAPTAGIRPKKFIGAKTLQNTLFGTNKL